MYVRVEEVDKSIPKKEKNRKKKRETYNKEGRLKKKHDPAEEIVHVHEETKRKLEENAIEEENISLKEDEEELPAEEEVKVFPNMLNSNYVQDVIVVHTVIAEVFFFFVVILIVYVG